jgi:predicted RNA-binding protein with PUA domain
LETTIKIDRKDSVDDLGSHFHWEQVDSFDTSDDEEAFQISNRGLFHTTRERSRTVTSETSSEGAEHLRNEAQVSWKNIPEKNTEHERNQSVLYVQKNSRIIFVGIIEESLLSDDYLNKLVRSKKMRIKYLNNQNFSGI